MFVTLEGRGQFLVLFLGFVFWGFFWSTLSLSLSSSYKVKPSPSANQVISHCLSYKKETLSARHKMGLVEGSWQAGEPHQRWSFK